MKTVLCSIIFLTQTITLLGWIDTSSIDTGYGAGGKFNAVPVIPVEGRSMEEKYNPRSSRYYKQERRLPTRYSPYRYSPYRSSHWRGTRNYARVWIGGSSDQFAGGTGNNTKEPEHVTESMPELGFHSENAHM